MGETLLAAGVGGGLMALGIAAILLSVAAYRGRFLGWTLGVPSQVLLGRHWGLLPLMLCGIAVLATGAYAWIALARRHDGDVPLSLTFAWAIGVAVLWAGGTVLSFWHPASAMPGWYTAWRARGADREEMESVIEHRRQGRRARRGLPPDAGGAGDRARRRTAVPLFHVVRRRRLRTRTTVGVHVRQTRRTRSMRGE